ncbi:MAG: UvrD-helicase domain-containing protein [Prevotella sp.]|nr:UvrD-helicase domain-containing protein [Prevotella sp.]
MVKPLTVYKASAGSGKTFTLATEYIRLVVENPSCFRSILAVTFTNKATEEMKRRILSQLYGIWKGLPDSMVYQKIICRRTGLSEEMVRQRAGTALHNLIYNYSDFRVMTIDTFFQGVLRNLARELDLTANLRIGLNDTEVEELAVDQMIDDLKVTDIMLQWLMSYILDNISDDRSWNVIGQIKQFGRTIFKDKYKAVSAEIQQKMAEPGFFERYTTQLKEVRRQALERMKEIAETFFDSLDAEQLTVEDFAYGRTGVCNFFLKLREGIFDESIVGKRVTDALGDPSKWYKKTHPQREIIHTLVDSTLNDILHYAIEERPRQWRLYQSADLTLRHLNQLRLLGSIEQKVRQLNEEANRFLLSDTQHLLHTLIDGSDSPFIFEKIGTQLEQVMIDEFQDTSTVQWQNFKILLAEAMSHQQSGNLIVGDVKQSIYRWRSGDWRLLNDIEAQFPRPHEQLDIQTLDTNYRSDRHIITFNNAFFHQAAELEYLSLDELPEAEQLRKAYADVEQQIPTDRPDEGFVSISLLPQENYQEQTLQQLVEGVKTLCQQGTQPSQIAILVRTNAYIPLIAQRFTEVFPEVDIVSDEAFRLDASSAVCLLIQAMRLLTRPDDRLTRACLATLYQRQVLGNEMSDEQLLLCTNNSFDDLLPNDYIQSFEELRAMPLYELTERLFAIFGLERLESQSAYICAFFDQLTDYLSEHPAPIAAFLREWDETLCSKTIQSDVVSGIRLISIHKSKGLEFDHVFIPFCDWQLEKQGDILWCQPHESPFDALPLAPIDYSAKQLLGTIYEPAYYHEHLQATVDNLNLLYVAFTRASKSLHVFGKRNARNTRSTLIEQALPLIVDTLSGASIKGLDDETSSLTFTYGTQEETPLSTSSMTVSSNPFLQSPEILPIRITTYQNKVKFVQSNRSREFLKN